MINVKNYKSYRKFLRDYYLQQKNSDKGSNIRVFSKALGMSAPALNMVLSGERNLTVHKLFDVASALKMSPDEIAYFEALVHFEQAKSRKEKAYYHSKVKDELQKKPANTVRITRKELLSDWYLPAFLLYLVDQAYNPKTQEFDIDYPLIEKKMGLTKEKAEQLFESLLNMGALEIRRDEKVHIVFEKVGGFLTNQSYVLKVLDEAMKRLKSRTHSKDAFYDAHTFTMGKDQMSEFISEYKKLINRFILEDDPENTEAIIYQSLAALFPIT